MIEFIKELFNPWEYGSYGVHNTARRHKRKGNIQIILWKTGKQGHKENFWYDCAKRWWHRFEKDGTQKSEESRNNNTVGIW